MPISIEDFPASHVFFIECYLQIFREPRGTNTWVMAPVNRGLIPLPRRDRELNISCRIPVQNQRIEVNLD